MGTPATKVLSALGSAERLLGKGVCVCVSVCVCVCERERERVGFVLFALK